MIDPDLDDIARLWRRPPTPEEERAFRAMVRRASLRARLLRHADLGIGILLVIAVAIAMTARPAPAMLAVGIVAVAGLGWSSWRRHLLGRIAATVESSDRRDLLRAATVNAEADLKRSSVGLWLFFPGVLLGALLNHSFKRERLAGFGRALWNGATEWAWGVATSIVILLAFCVFLNAHRRRRRALENLRTLEIAYREEARLDEAG